MMKIAFEQRLSLFITFLFCLFILPLSEHIAFTPPTDRKSLLLSYGLKALFAVFLYFLVYFTVHFIQRIRARDQFYISWLKYTGIYLAVMVVVFLFMYPGHWVHDEFNIVRTVRMYSLEYTWQHMFTNIFYTFCLYLFPTAVSIIVAQLVFASFVIGYICAQAQKLFRRPQLAYFLLIPFFFFPVVLNNFYPLRGTMYSYLGLLLICKLIFIYYKLDKNIRKSHELIKLTVLIMLVSFWRPEGVYYLALLPIVIIWFGVFKQKARALGPYVLVGTCLAIVTLGYVITKSTSSSKYEITAIINPLSTMIHEPLKGDKIDERLAVIDKSIDLDILKKYPSHTEAPAFWNGALRTDYEEHYDSLKKQYLYLILHNPKPFLDNRMKTFMATNSFDPVLPASYGPLSHNEYRSDPLAGNFVRNNYLATPINPSLKRKTVSFLLSVNERDQFSILGHLFWNTILPITILVIIGAYHLFKKEWFWAGIIALVLLRVPLIFLTAPANYFFYYLPVYVAGYFLIFFYFLRYIDAKLSHRRAHHAG